MKKIIFLFTVLALTIFTALPTMVKADPGVGRVANSITLTESSTNNEQVNSNTNMEEFINSKIEEFLGALAEQGVTLTPNNANIDFSTLFSTTEPYKYATVSDVNDNFVMIEGTLTKTYQVNYVTVNVTTTNANKTQITSADVTLEAPKIGDKVEKIKKDDGYGEYDAQSIEPTVTTTTEGIKVNAFWVSGLEDLSEEPFYGTFEEDTYYYAMIDFEAEEGYGFPATFPDGIKVNGAAPDEIFAVYGETYTHCIVKIKATKDTPKYEVKEGANLEYIINKDEAATFRIDADYSLFETDGKVFVDDVLVNKDNYVSKTGSTIITLAKSYMDTLSTGTHTLKVTFNNGGTSETTFTVAKQEEKNPQTSDNIISYISILGLSIISITGLYINKKKFN